MPCAVDAISTISNPANTAEAGLVPCAESGISTTWRGARRGPASALRIISIPVSSPCAPAAGCSVTRAIPVTAISACSSSHIRASAPCTWSSGCNGWSCASPARRTTSSLIRGLYFIVHEPSGYSPSSTL